MQLCNALIKSYYKDIYDATKCLFFLFFNVSIYLRNLEKMISFHKT